MKAPHVLLINPKIYDVSQNRRINAVVAITFPSSIGILAGCLRSVGISPVEIIDEQIQPLGDEDVSRILSQMSRPRVVGISTLTINVGRAYELAEKIKQVDSAAIVVMGGIHATVLPDEALSKAGVDVVVRGEAERTFPELVALILEGKAYHAIDGISIRQNGVVVHNATRPVVERLDDIPSFPYDLFETNLSRYPGFSSVLGSRGCPYQCFFCSSRNISGKKYRFHSVERVAGECETLIRKYKQSSVFFLDDNIAVNKKHFVQLCDELIRRGLSREAFFHGSMRGDNATEEILLKAREANFKIIYYGLETGVERLMTLIDKAETVEQVTAATLRAHKVGLTVGTTIIYGLPTETHEDRKQTLRLVRSLPFSSVRYNTLIPYPGTPAFAQLNAQGKLLVRENWANFGVQYLWEGDDIPYVPDESDRLELIWDTMYANLSAYLSLRGLLKLLKSPVAGGNVIRLRKQWFLSWREIRKLYGVFSYLAWRFIKVSGRVLWRKATRGRRGSVPVRKVPSPKLP